MDVQLNKVNRRKKGILNSKAVRVINFCQENIDKTVLGSSSWKYVAYWRIQDVFNKGYIHL